MRDPERSRQFWGAALSVFLLALGATAGWVLTISERVTKIETHQMSNERRLESLETGRTTPMSAEARATLAAVSSELAQLRRDFERELVSVHEGQAELLRYMMKLKKGAYLGEETPLPPLLAFPEWWEEQEQSQPNTPMASPSHDPSGG